MTEKGRRVLREIKNNKEVIERLRNICNEYGNSSITTELCKDEINALGYDVDLNDINIEITDVDEEVLEEVFGGIDSQFEQDSNSCSGPKAVSTQPRPKIGDLFRHYCFECKRVTKHRINDTIVWGRTGGVCEFVCEECGRKSKSNVIKI